MRSYRNGNNQPNFLTFNLRICNYRRMNGIVLSLKERVMLALHSKETSVLALAKATGLAQGTLASQLKRDSIQINFIEAILRTFPDISPDWLLMGEGEMYRSTSDDKYIALVGQMAELHKKHEEELLGIINSNRASAVNISNIGNTTINNNNNNDNGKDE